MGHFRGRNVLIVVAIAASVVIGGASVAWASSGGSSPSSAPGLSVGSHPFSSCHGIDYELWALPGLTNGDVVSLDVNGDETGLGGSDEIDILPPAADDYNWQNQSSLHHDDTTGNDTERVTFTASEGSGRYLIYLDCSNGGGAYDFVVESIRHVMRADFVPRPSVIPLRGSVSAAVVSGTGAGLTATTPFTFYLSLGGTTYHSTNTAMPSGGRVSFSYSFPRAWRGRRAVVWIASPGAGDYLPASTAHVAVTVR